MKMNNKLNIPRQIVIGDTIAWRDSNLKAIDTDTGRLLQISPATHTLSWAIRGATALDLVAVTSSDEFLTTCTALNTELLTSGINFFQAYATSNGARQLVGSGQITVVVSLESVASAFDGRSEKQKMLDTVNAAIQSILDGGAVQSYSIKGRSLSKMPMSELLLLRDKLKVEIVREKASEQVALGFGDPRRLYVRFGRP